jgi:ATP-dependent Clp protease ATP-binding subunit ClpA
MSAFDKYLETILDRAGNEARLDGSTTVEAQHLLLAVAADHHSAAGQFLASAGLDRDTIRGALDREFQHSLGAVGVAGLAFGLQSASPDPRRTPHPGSSVRLALERGVASGGRHMNSTHLLLGILMADVGTIPRALALAGVDRADLTARARAAEPSAFSGR